MTPEEKAKQLVEMFGNIHPLRMILTTSRVNRISKQCALICVDETIEEVERTKPTLNNMYYVLSRIDYWKQVKQHIEKL